VTRINVGIHPSELPDKLLLAEHREIKRIPNAVNRGKANLCNIPEQFTLGTGHVKFFYDKLYYLQVRYVGLYEECLARGFKVQNYISAWRSLPIDLYNGYKPTPADRQLIIDRITSKGFTLLPRTKEAQ